MLSLIIDFTVIITLFYISYKASREILSNRKIFTEFNQSLILAIIVFIYPLGPILLYVGSFYVYKIILFPVLALCYLPQLLIAMKQTKIFEVAGTDRVNNAKEALSLVTVGSILGLIYVSIYVIIHYAVNNLDNSYY